jgi:ribosomal protein L37AE/L43A
MPTSQAFHRHKTCTDFPFFVALQKYGNSYEKISLHGNEQTSTSTTFMVTNNQKKSKIPRKVWSCTLQVKKHSWHDTYFHSWSSSRLAGFLQRDDALSVSKASTSAFTLLFLASATRSRCWTALAPAFSFPFCPATTAAQQPRHPCLSLQHRRRSFYLWSCRICSWMLQIKGTPRLRGSSDM